VSPILGIWASQNYVRTPPEVLAYDSIETVTVGSGGASSISFTSIPGTYKHLQVRAMMKTSSANGVYDKTRFNSDTGTNYTGHSMEAGGANNLVNSVSNVGLDHLRIMAATNYGVFGTGTTGYPLVAILDILDYTNTNKYKVVKSIVGSDSNNGNGGVALMSGLWLNTNAITSITILAFAVGSASNFGQGSSFALYGIK
jgi:hypothetical protein